MNKQSFLYKNKCSFINNKLKLEVLKSWNCKIFWMQDYKKEILYLNQCILRINQCNNLYHNNI